MTNPARQLADVITLPVRTVGGQASGLASTSVQTFRAWTANEVDDWGRDNAFVNRIWSASRLRWNASVGGAEHIPKLIDYWCRVLLREPGYDGYILRAHQRVAADEPFRAEMFDRWFQLFVEAVDREWRGPVADRAKEHAAQIAGMLSRRVAGEDWAPSS